MCQVTTHAKLFKGYLNVQYLETSLEKVYFCIKKIWLVEDKRKTRERLSVQRKQLFIFLSKFTRP
jgi:hypothetical protein